MEQVKKKALTFLAIAVLYAVFGLPTKVLATNCQNWMGDLNREHILEPNPESGKDFYEILGVHPDASLKTVNQAFREASKKYHTDIAGNEPKNSASFSRPISRPRRTEGS